MGARLQTRRSFDGAHGIFMHFANSVLFFITIVFHTSFLRGTALMPLHNSDGLLLCVSSHYSHYYHHHSSSSYVSLDFMLRFASAQSFSCSVTGQAELPPLGLFGTYDAANTIFEGCDADSVTAVFGAGALVRSASEARSQSGGDDAAVGPSSLLGVDISITNSNWRLSRVIFDGARGGDEDLLPGYAPHAGMLGSAEGGGAPTLHAPTDEAFALFAYSRLSIAVTNANFYFDDTAPDDPSRFGVAFKGVFPLGTSIVFSGVTFSGYGGGEGFSEGGGDAVLVDRLVGIHFMTGTYLGSLVPSDVVVPEGVAFEQESATLTPNTAAATVVRVVGGSSVGLGWASAQFPARTVAGLLVEGTVFGAVAMEVSGFAIGISVQKQQLTPAEEAEAASASVEGVPYRGLGALGWSRSVLGIAFMGSVAVSSNITIVGTRPPAFDGDGGEGEGDGGSEGSAGFNDEGFAPIELSVSDPMHGPSATSVSARVAHRVWGVGFAGCALLNGSSVELLGLRYNLIARSDSADSGDRFPVAGISVYGLAIVDTVIGEASGLTVSNMLLDLAVTGINSTAGLVGPVPLEDGSGRPIPPPPMPPLMSYVDHDGGGGGPQVGSSPWLYGGCGGVLVAGTNLTAATSWIEGATATAGGTDGTDEEVAGEDPDAAVGGAAVTMAMRLTYVIDVSAAAWAVRSCSIAGGGAGIRVSGGEVSFTHMSALRLLSSLLILEDTAIASGAGVNGGILFERVSVTTDVSTLQDCRLVTAMVSNPGLMEGDGGLLLLRGITALLQNALVYEAVAEGDWTLTPPNDDYVATRRIVGTLMGMLVITGADGSPGYSPANSTQFTTARGLSVFRGNITVAGCRYTADLNALYMANSSAVAIVLDDGIGIGYGGAITLRNNSVNQTTASAKIEGVTPMAILWPDANVALVQYFGVLIGRIVVGVNGSLLITDNHVHLFHSTSGVMSVASVTTYRLLEGGWFDSRSHRGAGDDYSILKSAAAAPPVPFPHTYVTHKGVLIMVGNVFYTRVEHSVAFQSFVAQQQQDALPIMLHNSYRRHLITLFDFIVDGSVRLTAEGDVVPLSSSEPEDGGPGTAFPLVTVLSVIGGNSTLSLVNLPAPSQSLSFAGDGHSLPLLGGILAFNAVVRGHGAGLVVDGAASLLTFDLVNADTDYYGTIPVPYHISVIGFYNLAVVGSGASLIVRSCDLTVAAAMNEQSVLNATLNGDVAALSKLTRAMAGVLSSSHLLGFLERLTVSHGGAVRTEGNVFQTACGGIPTLAVPGVVDDGASSVDVQLANAFTMAAHRLRAPFESLGGGRSLSATIVVMNATITGEHTVVAILNQSASLSESIYLAAFLLIGGRAFAVADGARFELAGASLSGRFRSVVLVEPSQLNAKYNPTEERMRLTLGGGSGVTLRDGALQESSVLSSTKSSSFYRTAYLFEMAVLRLRAVECVVDGGEEGSELGNAGGGSIVVDGWRVGRYATAESLFLKDQTSTTATSVVCLSPYPSVPGLSFTGFTMDGSILSAMGKGAIVRVSGVQLFLLSTDLVGRAEGGGATNSTDGDSSFPSLQIGVLLANASIAVSDGAAFVIRDVFLAFPAAMPIPMTPLLASNSSYSFSVSMLMAMDSIVNSSSSSTTPADGGSGRESVVTIAGCTIRAEGDSVLADGTRGGDAPIVANVSVTVSLLSVHATEDSSSAFTQSPRFFGRIGACNNTLNGEPLLLANAVPSSVAAMMEAPPPTAGGDGLSVVPLSLPPLRLDVAEQCSVVSSTTLSLAAVVRASRTATRGLATGDDDVSGGPVDTEEGGGDEAGGDAFVTPITASRERSEQAMSVVLLATGGAIGSSSSGQALVAMAMLRVRRCGNDDDGDANDDDQLDVELSPFIHPLQFAVGSGPYRYYNGAIIGNCVVIPLAALVLLRGPLVWVLQRWGLPDGPSTAEVLTYIGWPSVMLVPFATLAEGTAASAVILLRSGHLEIILGVVGCAALFAVVGFWGVGLYRLHSVGIYRSPPLTVATLKSILLSSLTASAWSAAMRWRWPFEPLVEWLPPSSAADAVDAGSGNGGSDLVDSDVGLLSVGEGGSLPTAAVASTSQRDSGDAEAKRTDGDGPCASALIEQWANIIGDKLFLWADLGALLCAIAVGVIEGLGDAMGGCSTAVTTLAVFAVLQSVLSLTVTIPMEILLSLFTSACVVAIAVSATVSSWRHDGDDSAEALLSEASEELVGFIVNCLGFVGMVVGVTSAVVGLVRDRFETVKVPTTTGVKASPPSSSFSSSTLLLVQPLLGDHPSDDEAGAGEASGHGGVMIGTPHSGVDEPTARGVSHGEDSLGPMPAVGPPPESRMSKNQTIAVTVPTDLIVDDRHFGTDDGLAVVGLDSSAGRRGIVASNGNCNAPIEMVDL